MPIYHCIKKIILCWLMVVAITSKSAVHADELKADVLYIYAMQAFNLKDDNKAQQCFGELIANYPKSRWHWGAQLRLADLSEDPLQAEKLYLQVVEQTEMPEWANEARWGLSINRFAAGRFKEALAVFLIISQNEDVRQTDAYYYAGLCYIALKQFTEAEKVINIVLAKNLHPTFREMALRSLADIERIQTSTFSNVLESRSRQTRNHDNTEDAVSNSVHEVNTETSRIAIRDEIRNVDNEIESRIESQHAYSVQVGAFSNAEYASRLMIKLKNKKYPSFLLKVKSGDETFHQVRIGRFSTREEAENFLISFQNKEKMPGLIVIIKADKAIK